MTDVYVAKFSVKVISFQKILVKISLYNMRQLFQKQGEIYKEHFVKGAQFLQWRKLSC